MGLMRCSGTRLSVSGGSPPSSLGFSHTALPRGGMRGAGIERPTRIFTLEGQPWRDALVKVPTASGRGDTDDGTTLPTRSQPDNRRERKAPALTLKSARGKPLNVNIEPKEFTRLMFALGTPEPGFAN